jgi:hypothetical protein
MLEGDILTGELVETFLDARNTSTAQATASTMQMVNTIALFSPIFLYRTVVLVHNDIAWSRYFCVILRAMMSLEAFSGKVFWNLLELHGWLTALKD